MKTEMLRVPLLRTGLQAVPEEGGIQDRVPPSPLTRSHGLAVTIITWQQATHGQALAATTTHANRPPWQKVAIPIITWSIITLAIIPC